MKKIINHGDDFFIAATKDYDRDVDILHTRDQKFNASLKRSIQPGSIRIYDSIIVNEVGDNKKTGLLKTVMKVGINIMVDVIDIAIGFDETDEDELMETSIGTQWTAQAFNWPFYAIGTKDKEIIISTAFNPNYVQRYILPDRIITVV